MGGGGELQRLTRGDTVQMDRKTEKKTRGKTLLAPREAGGEHRAGHGTFSFETAERRHHCPWGPLPAPSRFISLLMNRVAPSLPSRGKVAEESQPLPEIFP